MFLYVIIHKGFPVDLCALYHSLKVIFIWFFCLKNDEVICKVNTSINLTALSGGMK